jgi:hypothetical protein
MRTILLLEGISCVKWLPAVLRSRTGTPVPRRHGGSLNFVRYKIRFSTFRQRPCSTAEFSTQLRCGGICKPTHTRVVQDNCLTYLCGSCLNGNAGRWKCVAAWGSRQAGRQAGSSLCCLATWSRTPVVRYRSVRPSFRLSCDSIHKLLSLMDEWTRYMN